ncbi:MAG: hypothetical protein A3A33_04230 [Candidatus Yanofskybacteria bacterium RIFCSPLOWO2_01_FULL_49_25]|uniref:Thioredoxin domain-containing protein n=1 Tax=Candidatus Yanofskybacteria bacterium RIFCSPLOWO2_01_FULL_49_25 TaxID=1802701 RepID=A0A1F8GTH8_9BACT|nr:MAG: hypothetical protein A3A33_04230 [Candidatus Yanofskybacteria bacterium RIFCSPLOWO2_01_FULL_49_25]
MSSVTPPSRPFLTMPLALVIAGVLIAGSIIYTKTPGTSGPVKPTPTPRVSIVLTDQDNIQGDSNAPVTIVEYSDFQCPFCRVAFRATLPGLLQEYVATGKAKLVYRHFPLSSIHPMAGKAAEASQCAAEQGKFWEMHDAIFNKQSAMNPAELQDPQQTITVKYTLANLKQWARGVVPNLTTFNACLDSGKYATRVQDDTKSGAGLGVQGTPTFFINGLIFEGAVPFDSLKPVIEAELAKKK